MLASLDSPAPREITTADGHAAFAPPDTLLFVRGQALIAQHFDPATLSLAGEPIVLSDPVSASAFRESRFSVSTTGMLASWQPPARSPARLAWVDRRGAVSALPIPPGRYANPSLSPDGKQVALSLIDETGEHIWTYDIERRTMSKRTFDGTQDTDPIWTHDSASLIFRRFYQRPPFIMRVPADGTGQAEPFVPNDRPGTMFPTSWSGAASLLAFENGNNIFVRDASGAVRPVLTGGANERLAQFSPAGRWLAYQSDATGRAEIWVERYPPDGSKWQVSTGGGLSPVWSPAGRELFFRNADQMMAVPIDAGPMFKAGTPRVLFKLAMMMSRYAVSPDGQRFLVLTPEDSDVTAASSPIQVIMNWREDLKRSASDRQ